MHGLAEGGCLELDESFNELGIVSPEFAGILVTALGTSAMSPQSAAILSWR